MAEQFDLSPDDVQRLLREPSGETRALMAGKVARTFTKADLTESEKTIAEDIFRVMVRDAEELVRAALAENLKESMVVPHDVALTLAQDVAISVSAPILEFSEVLTEEDLVEIVRSTAAAENQVAIASRRRVSSSVADALADTKNEDVVATLVSNEGADIGEHTFQKVIDEFGDNERINAPLVDRSSLPVSIAERLVTLVSDSLRDHLVTHHELPTDIATDLVLQSRERATMGLVAGDASEMDVQELVDQLAANGRLTPTIILRALCTGDLMFFESALAKLAAVPVSNVHILINDRGERGFRALYERCGLPRERLPFFHRAVRAAREMEYNGEPGDQDRYRRLMIERVLTDFADEFDADNIEYLLVKLDGAAKDNSASAVSVH